MKNPLIIILVVTLLALGGWYYMSMTPEANDSMMKDDASMNGGEKMEDSTPAGAPEAMTGSVKEFTVNGNNFKFDPATLSVKKGDTVKITFVNTGGFHDFVIDEFKVATPQIKDGQAVVEFVADKSGSFEYYCSVGTHRQMGMKGTLTVTE